MIAGDAVLDRIAAKIEPEPMSGCWLWGAAWVSGYAVLRVEGRLVYVHRYL